MIDPAQQKVLVTGGSGFFGEEICKKLLGQGCEVVIFDLNAPAIKNKKLSFIQGDIRNFSAVESALEGVSVVQHNVAQVPLAKDAKLFWDVNYTGTLNLLRAAQKLHTKKVIYTSSSAVYGVPAFNPVKENDDLNPMEPYGKAKYEAEIACLDFVNQGLDVSIIRPRTILGEGRLGIFQILFDWISEGKNIPLIGSGDNIYQFVHSEDLASACVSAGFMEGSDVFNIGAAEYDTLRNTLQSLIDAVDSKSKLVSLPINPTIQLMKFASKIGISPLGQYHSLMYHRSMYFNLDHSNQVLNYRPLHSNKSMILDAYKWYITNRELVNSISSGKSLHQMKIKKKLLQFLPYILR